MIQTPTYWSKKHSDNEGKIENGVKIESKKLIELQFSNSRCKTFQEKGFQRFREPTKDSDGILPASIVIALLMKTRRSSRSSDADSPQPIPSPLPPCDGAFRLRKGTFDGRKSPGAITGRMAQAEIPDPITVQFGRVEPNLVLQWSKRARLRFLGQFVKLCFNNST